MAGYLFNLGDAFSIEDVIAPGVYSTLMKAPTGYWRKEAEATFADFVTMKPGDHVYFFQQRVVYGVGELVAVGPDCKYCNFPGASVPEPVQYGETRARLLVDHGSASVDQRWLCTFRPAPHFFRRGVDMDDLLASNPMAFRILRANWKVSFIKFDPEEDQAFLDALLRANQHLIEQGVGPNESVEVFPWSAQLHRRMGQVDLSDYALSVGPILERAAEGAAIKHEMAIEAGLLAQISEGDSSTIEIFGEWPYLSHQVIASPFKAIDWMDKMDIFGQAAIHGHPATIARYLVGEVKKGQADLESVAQVMKYVDWVKDEYAFGDYSMIRAFLVAEGFPESVRQEVKELAPRRFTVGRRPPRTELWQELRLVSYRYANGRLEFDVVDL